jgi:hypothetical protein
VVGLLHLCQFVAWQDIKMALGLPSGIKLGQYNALAAFTANPSGPGRKVGMTVPSEGSSNPSDVVQYT